MLCDTKENNHIVLLERQSQVNQDINTCKNFPVLLTGSTLALQREDGGPRMHRITMGLGLVDHNGRSSESEGPKHDVK